MNKNQALIDDLIIDYDSTIEFECSFPLAFTFKFSSFNQQFNLEFIKIDNQYHHSVFTTAKSKPRVHKFKNIEVNQFF